MEGHPVETRSMIVQRVAEVFKERSDELAAIITQEMGKQIEESKGELGTVFDIFSYYAQNGQTLMADEPLEIQGGSALIQKRPVGVILGIMPWNYPYYQVARFVAPNLMLGNTILLKHASNCPKSAAASSPCFVKQECQRTPTSISTPPTSRSLRLWPTSAFRAFHSRERTRRFRRRG